jgi:hypothetical protein
VGSGEVTTEDFRRLALALPDVTEQSHMNHPDFRVGGKIFATLGYPDAEWAMVSLPPVDQDLFIHADPLAFIPVRGAWGKQGATNVRLSKAKKELVTRALESARRYRIEKSMAKGGKKAERAEGITAPRGGRRAAPPASSAGAPKAATTSRRSRPPATPPRRPR